MIRARGNAADLAEAAHRVIGSVDPAQPVAAVRTMDDMLELEVADRHQQMVLLAAGVPFERWIRFVAGGVVIAAAIGVAAIGAVIWFGV